MQKFFKKILLFSISLLVFAAHNGFAGQKKAENMTPVYTENQTAVSVTIKEPLFIIKLRSNPTTGYSWTLLKYDETLVTNVKHQFVPPADKKLMGAPGFETWTFKMNPVFFDAVNQAVLEFVYKRAWAGNEPGAKILKFQVANCVGK